MASAGASRALPRRVQLRSARHERTRLRCSCAALRQLQRGFFHRRGTRRRRRPGAWSRAAAGGTAAALRGWSVPLITMTSMTTTNRAAPGGARQRRAAHVRPRCTCRPNARVIGSAPHSTLAQLTTTATRCRVRCTRALGRPIGDQRTCRRLGGWSVQAPMSEPTGRAGSRRRGLRPRALSLTFSRPMRRS